jgi:hypothetical protein
MSLMRTALRLQAIEALNSDPVIDAMVQGRVYDSRISAFDHREPVPTILLTTEETKGEAIAVQNGGGPFWLSCDLVLEIAMNAVSALTDSDGGSFEAIAYAATDRELEAQLDLIEHRAVIALTSGETPAARLLREAVVRRVTHIASSRFATDQTGEKFAVHLVTLRVDLLTPEPEDPFDVPTGDYAILPVAIRTVCEASDPNGSVRATCDLLVANLSPLGTPAVPASFTGADMILAPQALDAARGPDREADLAAGRTVALVTSIPNS